MLVVCWPIDDWDARGKEATKGLGWLEEHLFQP